MARRGKKAIPVDKFALTACIQEVEKDGPLSNQKEVWEKAAKLYNEKRKPERPLSHSIVQLRAKKWKIKIKTKSAKGRRGPMSPEHKKKFLAARGKRKSKKEKFANDSNIQDAITQLRVRVPDRFDSTFKKYSQGSRTAATKLMCLECCAYDTGEIRRCHIRSCPLWPFRPYKQSLGDEDHEAGEDKD